MGFVQHRNGVGWSNETWAPDIAAAPPTAEPGLELYSVVLPMCRRHCNGTADRNQQV